MSLPMKIMNLVKNLRDPSMRIDVASTINYLADLFSLGKITEENLREDLEEICSTVLQEIRSDLTKEEIKELAKKEVNELVNLIKFSMVRKRMSTKYRSTLM